MKYEDQRTGTQAKLSSLFNFMHFVQRKFIKNMRICPKVSGLAA
jgi:hypothetical protein